MGVATVSTNLGTHVPILAYHASLVKRGGKVVEFGGGTFSTPMLTGICRARGVYLVTVEPDMGWAAILQKTEGVSHTVLHGQPEDYLLDLDTPDLVFIDCDPPASRMPMVKKAFGAGVETIVIHDTNRVAYGWDWEGFDNIIHHRTGRWHTTVIRQEG